MRIAICDDNMIQINIIEDYIQKIAATYKKLDCDAFCSGEELLKQYLVESNPYDIIFLDIEMGEINGIETAKKLRDLDEKAIIVYISSHQEYVFDCFEVNPFRFIMKPVSFEDFSKVFNMACKKIFKSKKTFYFNNGGMSIRIYCDDILYFESHKRKVIVNTKEKQYEFYSKLEKILSELENSDFLQVHKSYVVNMNSIKEIDSTHVKLLDGKTVPISENNRKIVRAEHLKFLARSV